METIDPHSARFIWCHTSKNVKDTFGYFYLTYNVMPALKNTGNHCYPTVSKIKIVYLAKTATMAAQYLWQEVT